MLHIRKFKHVRVQLGNKNENKLFDITMGGKHGAEVCELFWLYILLVLKDILPIF